MNFEIKLEPDPVKQAEKINKNKEELIASIVKLIQLTANIEEPYQISNKSKEEILQQVTDMHQVVDKSLKAINTDSQKNDESKTEEKISTWKQLLNLLPVINHNLDGINPNRAHEEFIKYLLKLKEDCLSSIEPFLNTPPKVEVQIQETTKKRKTTTKN